MAPASGSKCSSYARRLGTHGDCGSPVISMKLKDRSGGVGVGFCPSNGSSEQKDEAQEEEGRGVEAKQKKSGDILYDLLGYAANLLRRKRNLKDMAPVARMCSKRYLPRAHDA